MDNNDNEGHPDYTIDNIAGQALNSLPERPNVVLLIAGINDIVQVLNLYTIFNHLGNLIDTVINDCPDAAIIVISLTPLVDLIREVNRKAYNQAILGVIISRVNADKYILLVDISVVTDSVLVINNIYPNDAGYILIINI